MIKAPPSSDQLMLAHSSKGRESTSMILEYDFKLIDFVSRGDLGIPLLVLLGIG